jgi:hypothetical protein
VNRDTIVQALTLLGRKVARSGIEAQLSIFGGTVMMLAYNLREGTKDVDAIYYPREELQPLIAEVASDLRLDPNWLNDHVQQFTPNDGGRANIPFEALAGIAGIAVLRPTARKMLAMKARAARLPRPGHGGDLHDLAFLIRHCGIRSIEEIEKTFTEFYGESLDPKQTLVAERALEIAYAPNHPKTQEPR